MTSSWCLERSSLTDTPPFHGLARTQGDIKGSEGKTQLQSVALAPSLQEKMFAQVVQQSSNTVGHDSREQTTHIRVVDSCKDDQTGIIKLMGAACRMRSC